MIELATPCTNPTMVIADDQPAFRMLLSETLDRPDCTILEAENVWHALDLVRRTKPQVAVLDVEMPGLNGLEVTRAIRSEAALDGTKVIVVTGRGGPDDIKEIRAAGADYYLIKPFAPGTLKNAVAVA